MSHDAHDDGHSGHDANDSHADTKKDSNAPEKKGSSKPKTDTYFEKIMKYVTGKIATFVAFLFFLITLGAIYAVVLTKANLSAVNTILILAPAAVGLIAYYNRDIAMVIFLLFFAGIILI